MGSCISGKIKAEGAPQNRDIPRYGDDDGDGKNMSSSEVPSCTMPTATHQDGGTLQHQRLKSFNLSVLKAATGDFHPDSLLSDGLFWVVFKGWIDEYSLAASTPERGMAVAVKLFKHTAFHGQKEWLTEINYLGHLHHPNLVKLIGYCLEDNHHFLVYEYVPNGRLEDCLLGSGDSKIKPLSWNLRMKISLDVAKVLAFLHKDIRVTHQFITASNILLDSVVNFGLVKDEMAGGASHIATTGVHTGYSAPEYSSIGHPTMNNDVYMFGVILLQMLSGRRATDHSRPPGEHDLVEWARPCLNSKRKIFRILDANLERQYSTHAMLQAADLIVKCLSTEPSSRPDMEEVVNALEQIYDSSLQRDAL